MALRGDVCCYCLKLPDPEAPGTIDHIVPIGMGGRKNSWENATASCRYCNNNLRGDRPLLFFLMRCRELATRKCRNGKRSIRPGIWG